MTTPTRYFYAFKYADAVITDDEQNEGYLVKVGVSGAGEDFPQVLRRLYDHNNSAESRLGMTLRIPTLTSKENTFSPTKGKTQRASGICVQLDSFPSLVSFMAFLKSSIVTSREQAHEMYAEEEEDMPDSLKRPYRDLMFVLPFYSNAAFVPTTEALLRHSLGGAVFGDFLPRSEKMRQIINPKFSPYKSNPLNLSEMIVCNTELFRDIRTLWRSNVIETVEKLMERTDASNLIFNTEYSSVKMEWSTSDDHEAAITFRAARWTRSMIKFK